MKKNRNNIKKSIALFLIATLLFVGLPTQGLILNANADTEANPQVSVSEMDSITYTEDNDVYILAEDVSKRGEFEKHYLCSDGNFIAVAYPEAIHRLDENGQWVDLDFSLVLNTSAHAYESQNGDFRVAFCSGISATSDASVMSSSVTQTQNTDLISLQNGIYSLSWGLYANMAMTNPISSSAMQSSGISSTSETASLPATLNTIQINGNVAGVESTAAISDMENKSIYDTDTFDLSKVSNSVEYHSVFGADEGISLRYTVSYNKIEEDIILTKATNVTSFSLSVDADGLVPMLNQDNSVDFLDENGDMVYHIGIPYMVDAAFAVLNDIQVTVNTDSANTNGRWLITYTPNNEWLQAEERVYPIMLDPSITTNEYQSYIEDTYVEENSTVDHSDEQYLYITKNGNNRREAVVRITKLPTIEASMPIVSATLHMVAQYGPFSTLSMKSVYGATFWDISECAYGDSVFMDEPITSTGLLSASDTGLTFDISNCISRMYDDEQEAQASGSPYYGDFIIGFYDADDSNFCYPFLSTEYATVSSRPTFTVKYGYTLPADMEEGEVFSFESVYSYSFMTVNGINPANNSNIYQVDNGNEIAITTQQFKLERVSSTGGYLLRSMSSSNGTDKVVSVQRGSSSVSSGQNVCLASATDALAQEWFIVPVNCAEFRIVPRANMSLALTTYGIDDGSNSGRTTTSEGNIFVQTINTDSYQQRWYIYDSENHVVETDDYRSTLETDEYYITNKYVGKYLHRTGNTVDCKQGTINGLNAQEETVKWKIVNLGDGYCTIQRYDRPGLYMVPESTSSGSSITFRSTSDTSLPDKFKWSIRITAGGDYLIQNKESKLYLYAFEQSANPSLVRSYGLYSAGSVGYKKQVWRFVASDDYMELDYGVTFNSLTLDINESKTPSVQKSPDTALWANASDFTYNIESGSQFISYNSSDNSFTGVASGTAVVRGTHKTTGISRSFTITVHSLLIYQTRDRERLGFSDSSDNNDITPITAEDLTYGQKSTDTLITNGTLISMSDLLENGVPISLSQRVTIIKNFFNSQISYDPTFTTILSQMVDHFVGGSGDDYSNTDLTNAVKNHPNTQNYVNSVVDIVKDQISNANGNIENLLYDEQLWLHPLERKDQVIVKAMLDGINAGNNNLYLPSYGYNNGVPGLTLAIDGWYGNKIEIASFEESDGYYSGTLRFTFYDHFGLDTPDLSEEKYGNMKAGTIPGFRQWYILQHWDSLGYSVQPKPFVTVVSYSVSFSGTY